MEKKTRGRLGLAISIAGVMPFAYGVNRILDATSLDVQRETLKYLEERNPDLNIDLDELKIREQNYINRGLVSLAGGIVLLGLGTGMIRKS